MHVGKCCTGSSGYVWINEDDIKNISTYLKISKDEFIENYTVYEGDKRRYTLKERVVATKPWEEEQIDTTYDCIFLEGTKYELLLGFSTSPNRPYANFYNISGAKYTQYDQHNVRRSRGGQMLCAISVHILASRIDAKVRLAIILFELLSVKTSERLLL
jgi:hypothetical protein